MEMVGDDGKSWDDHRDGEYVQRMAEIMVRLDKTEKWMETEWMEEMKRYQKTIETGQSRHAAMGWFASSKKTSLHIENIQVWLQRTFCGWQHPETAVRTTLTDKQTDRHTQTKKNEKNSLSYGLGRRASG